ncbi:hypothetical protein [Ruegeria meonggei]|uniref:Uncharacterized protein n=1 Tax=Ruegeria meonggei TaxID=1446476 RepID=A0A1X6ZFA5_9RHOB|nr:hypothetical protein [Ruegeria meonggei]SLN49568.1 hypothetical protein RUM8411_02326 [Ruegeria meonggei]
MYEGYDKPLHAPLKYKAMESEGRALDESKLDSALADLFSEESDEEPAQPVAAEVAARTEQVFPDLTEQEEIDLDAVSEESGLGAALLQKWAEFRGAA